MNSADTGRADAIAMGPLAYDLGMPILLTEAHGLLAATRAVLTASRIRLVVIVGSDTAVSERINDSLADDVGAVSVRLPREVRDYLADTPGYRSGHGDTHMSVLAIGSTAVVSRAVMAEAVAAPHCTASCTPTQATPRLQRVCPAWGTWPPSSTSRRCLQRSSRRSR